MGVIVAFLAAIFISVAGRVLADEFKAFRPNIVDWLLSRAVSKMPSELQERYEEEWRGHLEDVPGDLAKVWTAFGYNLVANRLKSSFFSWEIGSKRALDLVVCISACVGLAPLLLVIAAAIWIEDRKAPLIRLKRVGKNGRNFYCIKFRTMMVNGDAVLSAHLAANPEARAEWLANFRLKDDPRVTSVGYVLRKTSLDELPQWINLWRGEMSLVGPRPIVAAEIERYGTHFATCFSVTPGLTGAWQIAGRADTTYAERVAEDLNYVQNWSLRRDLEIMLRTVPAVLAQRGSR
ncbi:sugar transferase [Methylobacterium sp. D53M]